MRKFIVALIVIAGLGAWLALRKPPARNQSLKSYFSSGSSVKAGAQVRVDGVVVGSVTGVRVRPDLGERPVEVEMEISTSYELKIPSDSVVKLATDGLLGPTIADIDTTHANGPPLSSNGVLKSSEVAAPDSEAMKRLTEATRRLADSVSATTNDAGAGPRTPASSSSGPSRK